jgi:hypothetical protein
MNAAVPSSPASDEVMARGLLAETSSCSTTRLGVGAASNLA